MIENANSFPVGALSGIRILDLTRVLAGPFCTMMMADLGAEVIKIEIPGKGDDSRQYPPFKNGESAYFMNLNRNKKGIELNLKHHQGKEIFIDLLKKSDVVIENFKPGTMERLNLGYEDLKKVNKKIVYGCISGFGHYGSYKYRPGYDLIGQAMGGMMSVTGWPDSPPTRTGTAISDILAGLSCCIGILSALRARDISGEGQKVDIALVDSVVAAMENINQLYIVENKIPQRIGNRYEFFYPYDSFKSSDGWFVFAVGNQEMWKRFCQTIEDKELCEDERFCTMNKRVENHKTLKEEIEKWTKSRKTKDIVELFLSNNIPSAPIYSVDQVVNDKHIAEDREMFVEVVHPIAGITKVTGSHLKLYKNKPTIRQAAPTLGQHTKEVLTGILGFSEEKIKDLKENKII